MDANMLVVLGEVEKVVVRILREEKAWWNEVAAELEVEEREWVVV